jgi:ribosome recycling factor
MDESVFAKGRARMEEVLGLVKEELAGVQTGRAKPAMIESVKVEAYEGTILEIRELALITAPDPHNLVIKPWDGSVLAKIEKAIQKSGLEFNPVVDNEVIRIKIPALSEERRREMVKLVGQRIESGKAMLRQVRIEMKKEIDDLKDSAGVSEDDIHQMYERLQKLIDEYNQKLEEMEQTKEKELMEI